MKRQVKKREQKRTRNFESGEGSSNQRRGGTAIKGSALHQETDENNLKMATVKVSAKTQRAGSCGGEKRKQ